MMTVIPVMIQVIHISNFNHSQAFTFNIAAAYERERERETFK